MPMRPEPEFAHDRSPRLGVLLVNLGTPDAPTASAVRRYLAEFLADPRVVEIPRAAWLPILHGVILRVRPARSAAKYAKIWANEGSPLLVHSQRQCSLLQGALRERLVAAGLPADLIRVELGMRYGNPAVGPALDALRAAGCDRVLVVPLYPQYAASTTASTVDAVSARLRGMRRVPGLRIVDCFHDQPGYIAALARNIEDFWSRRGRPDRLVLSFHGVPRRTLDLGDPYFCQCQKTARLLTEALGLRVGEVRVTFQSRFGKAEWLQPYTQESVVALARDGVRRVDVACPGFVADCLETLEEIGMEVRKAFLDAGGAEFNVVPCLNDHPRWIAALADIVAGNLQGWLGAPPDAGACEMTQLRARGMGAAR